MAGLMGLTLTPGITYTYKVIDITGDGFVNVEVTATKGSLSSAADIQVKGFKS